MTPRRAKMIRDLQLQRRAPQTQQAYGSAVAGFAKFYQCSPDRLRPEPIRTYRHRLLLMTTYAAGRRVSEVVRLKLTDSESEGKRVQTMTLDADECIRRFLWHVRPRGFMRLRHDGFLAHRHAAVGNCWASPPSPPRRPKSVGQWRQEVTGIALTQCPPCGARPLIRLPLPSLATPPASRGTPVEVPSDDSSCARGGFPGCRSQSRNGSRRALRGTCVSMGV
jgi:Putative transposase